MFSKPKTGEAVPQPATASEEKIKPSDLRPASMEKRSPEPVPTAAPKAKPAASVFSPDLTITGNVHSSGDIQIEGTIEGDVRAQTLIVGETAVVKGEVSAEEVICHGRVIGRLRGVKVRLSSTARVEGDIVHKTIAIESGAHFEGSVQRHDDPVGKSQQPQAVRSQPAAASTAAE